VCYIEFRICVGANILTYMRNVIRALNKMLDEMKRINMAQIAL